MEDRSDAFLALPRGIGTLEELFETWTAGYLGMHEKPVVLLDPTGHYDGLRTWLGSLSSPVSSRRQHWTAGGRRRRRGGARRLRTPDVTRLL